MQESLKAVGCYSGAIDGVIGPQTTTAIRDFQAGSHLTADGVYGPGTEGLLTAAAKAGVKSCTSTPTTTGPTTTTTVPATTTSAAATSAPCTAAAISAALGTGKTLISYQCGNGWAGGSWSNSAYEAAFLLRSRGGVWVQPPTDACNEATALGIPADVLNISPCKVS
jgi:peptidoglycan hydrolase-like protein with peptidoglycan-binding domain